MAMEKEWGYLSGWQEGAEQQREIDRTETFAAIRRAAEVARSLDASKHEHRKAGNWIDAVCYEWRAYSIRVAIRAAIGSEKA